MVGCDDLTLKKGRNVSDSQDTAWEHINKRKLCCQVPTLFSMFTFEVNVGSSQTVAQEQCNKRLNQCQGSSFFKLFCTASQPFNVPRRNNLLNGSILVKGLSKNS